MTIRGQDNPKVKDKSHYEPPRGVRENALRAGGNLLSRISHIFLILTSLKRPWG